MNMFELMMVVPVLSIGLPLSYRHPILGWALWAIAAFPVAFLWNASINENHDVSKLWIMAFAALGTIPLLLSLLFWATRSLWMSKIGHPAVEKPVIAFLILLPPALWFHYG